jgi:hypothetical protein
MSKANPKSVTPNGSASKGPEPVKVILLPAEQELLEVLGAASGPLLSVVHIPSLLKKISALVFTGICQRAGVDPATCKGEHSGNAMLFTQK